MGVVLWALLTGIVTGGVWAGIVLLSRQRRLSDDHNNLLADVERHLHDRAELEGRLAAQQPDAQQPDQT